MILKSMISLLLKNMDSHPTDFAGGSSMMQTAVKTKKPRKQAVSGRFWAERTYRGRIKDDHKIDPACGSGGFILTAMNYIFDEIDNSGRTVNAKEVLKRNVVHQLFGVDISPKLVKIAKANILNLVIS